jgi:hypothetical protein
MRKLIVGIGALCLCGHSYAQTVEIDAKGMFKSTWLANVNVSNAGATQDFALGWGYNYGAGVTFYFNSMLGIGIDGLINSHTANYKGIINDNNGKQIGDYTSSVTLNSLDIPVLFKIKNKGGGFLELGAAYCVENSATYSASGTQSNASFTSTSNVDQYYAKTNIVGVLGLGIKIKFSDRLSMKTGLRFEYGFTDLKGLDAMGRDLTDSMLYPTYKPTNSVAGGIMLGLTYTLGSEVN